MKPIVSLTFPKEILDKIDESRGDISRSRYVLRLIQKAYDVQVKEVENWNDWAWQSIIKYNRV